MIERVKPEQSGGHHEIVLNTNSKFFRIRFGAPWIMTALPSLTSNDDLKIAMIAMFGCILLGSVVAIARRLRDLRAANSSAMWDVKLTLSVSVFLIVVMRIVFNALPLSSDAMEALFAHPYNSTAAMFLYTLPSWFFQFLFFQVVKFWYIPTPRLSSLEL